MFRCVLCLLASCLPLLAAEVGEPTAVSAEAVESAREKAQQEPAASDAEAVEEEPVAEAEEVAPAKPGAPRRVRIISKSRQFVVYGRDSLVAGAVATKADEIRSELLAFLDLPATWKHQVTLSLTGDPAAPAVAHPIRTRINVIDGTPGYEIRVHVGGGINLEKLHAAIVTMLLYERALRQTDPDAFPEEVSLPPWLATGIDQALLWRAGKIDRRLYQSLFERSEMLSPEQILGYKTPEKLDASTRSVYDASCGVLAMCLANQPGGKDALIRLLDQAILGEGAGEEMIARHFHSFGLTSNALNKWWALQLANLASATPTECYTPAETESRLVEALTFMYYDAETRTPIPVSLDDVEQVTAIPDWKNQSRRVLDQLVHLNIRCFPGYRPIITEYCRIIASLQHGLPPEEAIQLIGPLIELRESYTVAALRARDYLDWYEITYLGGRSGSFNSYLDAMNMLRAEPERSSSPLSAYLDDIEALHTLPARAATPSAISREVSGKSTR